MPSCRAGRPVTSPSRGEPRDRFCSRKAFVASVIYRSNAAVDWGSSSAAMVRPCTRQISSNPLTSQAIAGRRKFMRMYDTKNHQVWWSAFRIIARAAARALRCSSANEPSGSLSVSSNPMRVSYCSPGRKLDEVPRAVAEPVQQPRRRDADEDVFHLQQIRPRAARGFCWFEQNPKAAGRRGRS